MDPRSAIGYDLLVGVLGNAAFGGLLLILTRLGRQFQRQQPKARVAGLIVSSVIFVVVNVLFWHYAQRLVTLFLILSTAILVFGWWWEIRHFWSLGILGVRSPSTEARRYDGALALCTNSLDFLGVGAHKLTSRKAAFEAAVKRCHREDRPIRFLLCEPNNHELVKMAQRAGRSDTEYQENVRASLRVLKWFREQRAVNIEVRFYSELPVFRLMFANDDLCLVSHYVFGEGDGSDGSEVYVSSDVGERDTLSIYYGFKQYFETMWNRSTTWDFQTHLGDE